MREKLFRSTRNGGATIDLITTSKAGDFDGHTCNHPSTEIETMALYGQEHRSLDNGSPMHLSGAGMPMSHIAPLSSAFSKSSTGHQQTKPRECQQLKVQENIYKSMSTPHITGNRDSAVNQE